MTTPRDTDRGWSREFEEPIPLPKGRQLLTLMDAGDYITKLPEAEHTAPEWQAAMEALILVVTLGGPTMFARIGVMKALNRHVERVFLIARCVAAPKIDPFRRPTLTPVNRCNPKRVETLTVYAVAPNLGADWGSKATPIHS